MLGLNYDLSPDELAELLVWDEDDDAARERWDAIDAADTRDPQPKSLARWLTLACRLAGYHGDDIDAADAHDLAAELVRQKRLTPWIEWAGGEHLAAGRGRGQSSPDGEPVYEYRTPPDRRRTTIPRFSISLDSCAHSIEWDNVPARVDRPPARRSARPRPDDPRRDRRRDGRARASRRGAIRRDSGKPGRSSSAAAAPTEVIRRGDT